MAIQERKVWPRWKSGYWIVTARSSPVAVSRGFLIDGRTLLDAGVATSVMTLEEQSQMDHVLISHVHLDHIREPASLADNLCYIRRNHPLTVISTPQVIETLKRHIFNGAIWPDFSILPSAEKPFLRFEPLRTGEKMRVGHSGPSFRRKRSRCDRIRIGIRDEDGHFRRGHRADRGDLACCREGGEGPGDLR
jgi:ribonuclease BN (tRNA processing enzyme)